MNVQQLAADPTTQYLGDGVYVRHDGFQLWLHVTNGVHITDSIALDRQTTSSLIHYATKVFGEAK